MGIRGNNLPVWYTYQTAKIGDFFQLFFAAEVVANIVKQNSAMIVRVGVFYQQRDGNRGTAAAIKNLPTFLAR